GDGSGGSGSGSGSGGTFDSSSAFCAGLNKSIGCNAYQEANRIDLCNSDPCGVSSKGCMALTSQISYGTTPNFDICVSK
ncbi:MAG: hypothetical protein PHS27_00640, partial [Candidatus Pacebacteria bacterium]|nr:hypothetical protein [Candidatus Paceibacterota bacterium]